MYLTRLTLDPDNAQARRDLASCYDMHRTLSRAFVLNDQDPPARFLWRLESSPNTASARPTLLLQSGMRGNWDVLHALPGYLQGPAECKAVDLESFVQARPYRFRLLANPTVTRMGKRHGLVGEPDQLAWLQRQGTRHGFAVEAASANSSDMLAERRKGDAPLVVRRVCFEGLLQVSKPESVRLALVNGIGPAKAFGCGLLSLARI